MPFIEGFGYEKSLRESIAKQVSEKMDYLGTCLNERDAIISIILNDPKPFSSHCFTDCKQKCVIGNNLL